MSVSDTNTIDPREQSPARPVWLLAYFRQIYPDRVEVTPHGVELVPLTDEVLVAEELHLAFSRDGLRWTPLNENRPVVPNTSGRWRVRDPFIQRGPDGWFHLVATGGAAPRHLLYSRSRDLIEWDDPRSLPVVESEPGVRNVWAPEWVFDTEQGNYFVFWSSSNGEHGWDDSRIWCARTTDWLHFTPPRVLFDPGYTVIDATILQHEGAWFMFFKDERFGHVHGEHRFIKVATADRLDGPYQAISEAITPCLTEGPAILRLENPPRWQLIYDHCMDNRYGAAVSSDLQHWEVVDDAQFPPNARHASVFTISEAELELLLEHFGVAALQRPPVRPG